MQARVRARQHRELAIGRWLRAQRRHPRRLRWSAVALIAVVAAVLTWAVWPGSAPEPRARQYRDVTACLLTDDQGVRGPDAAVVWSGMQDASLATLAQVQYLEVNGAQTADNAATYLASLVQSRCRIILAVGEAPVAAVGKGAQRFPEARFVVVGASGVSAANVTLVGPAAPDALRADVARVVRAAVGPA